MTGIETGLLVNASKTFLDRIISPIETKLKSGWQKFDWQTAQRIYFEKIEKDYGWTRIIGKPEPIQLDGIFTDVYLLDRPTAFLRFDIETLNEEPEKIRDKQIRKSGLDFVKKNLYKRLYILGKPGAGKTTFLKYIALQASKGIIRKIPVFISLKEWADSGLDLLTFVIKQFDVCGFPDSKLLVEHLLDTGKTIVLFDGLDETQQENGMRDQIIDQLRNFSRKYDDTQVLITCRIAATDYTFDEFFYLEVADFTEEQVETYVGNWFGDKVDIEAFNDEFNKPENNALREMATTPLLLSLLCINFEETLSFPQRRVEIYEESINALLHKWDASRKIKRDEIYKGLSLGRKKQMFARIASQTFGKNQYFFSQKELEKYIVDYLSQLPEPKAKEDIDSEAVLKAIEAQHSIFIERARCIYSFSHLTFQEYFIAKYIVDNAEKGTLKLLLKVENLSDNRWREVILITASLLDNADSFFQIFFNSINQTVKNDFELIEVFNWINQKVDKINSNNDILLNKLFYSYVFVLRDFSFDEFNNRSRNKTINSILDLMKNINPIFANNLALLTDKDFDVEFETELMIDYCLIFLEIISSGMLEIQTKIELFYTTIAKLKKLCIESKNNKVYQEINKLGIPTQSNPDSIYKFSDGIQNILQKIRYFPQSLGMTVEQNEKLTAYIKSNELLLSSLSLAALSNRQKIYSSMFEV